MYTVYNNNMVGVTCVLIGFIVDKKINKSISRGFLNFYAPASMLLLYRRRGSCI